MITPLTYTPPSGAFAEVRPTIALVALLAPAAVAMAFANPIVLSACAIAVVIAARGAGALGELRAAAKAALALGLLIVIVNGLIVRRGETILFRGPEVPLIGRLDVTAEALLEGMMVAGRIAIVIGAFAIVSARVDPDYLLRSIRRYARRSALTATLLVRLVPLAVADLSRLREAREMRGPGATPLGRAAILRRLVSTSLERSADAAAALEVRGYGASAGRIRLARHAGRHDRLFALAAAATLLVGAAGRIAGAGSFDAYPTAALAADPATVALALAIPLLGALPWWLARRKQ